MRNKSNNKKIIRDIVEIEFNCGVGIDGLTHNDIHIVRFDKSIELPMVDNTKIPKKPRNTQLNKRYIEFKNKMKRHGGF